MIKDLMGWLLDGYNEWLELPENKPVVGQPTKNAIERTFGSIPAVNAARKLVTEEFVDFCRRKLKETPPTGVYMAAQGVGLKMSDASEIPVIEQTVPDGMNAWMPVTNPGRGPMDRIESPSIPVFGGK